jgi:hypothetical protein
MLFAKKPVNSGDKQIESITFTGICVLIPSTKTFKEVTSALISLTGRADMEAFRKLIEADVSASRIEEAVTTMAGNIGFMIFDELQQGPLMCCSEGRRKPHCSCLAIP